MSSVIICIDLRYEIEYEDAKRKTKETLHPLRIELADLEDQVNYLNSFHFLILSDCDDWDDCKR